MVYAPCQDCPLRRFRGRRASRPRAGDCPACMIGHLERVAERSGAESSPKPRLTAGGGRRGPGDVGAVPTGLPAAQAHARGILTGCAEALADVTAACDRVDAALRHRVR